MSCCCEVLSLDLCCGCQLDPVNNLCYEGILLSNSLLCLLWEQQIASVFHIFLQEIWHETSHCSCNPFSNVPSGTVIRSWASISCIFLSLLLINFDSNHQNFYNIKSLFCRTIMATKDSISNVANKNIKFWWIFFISIFCHHVLFFRLGVSLLYQPRSKLWGQSQCCRINH